MDQIHNKFGRYVAPRTRGSRGTVMVWAIVSMVALMAFVSLAVDMGRVQLAKTELQRAADAAARYGATGLVFCARADKGAVAKVITMNTATSILVWILFLNMTLFSSFWTRWPKEI